MKRTQIPKAELWDLEKIRPYDRNPRKNEHAVEKVAASIERFGWTSAILIDDTGLIINGHTRWKAAKELGLKKVPVRVARGWSETEKNACRISDNKLAEIADWDMELLPLEMAALEAEGLMPGDLGFEDDEFSIMCGTKLKQGKTDPDEVPDPPSKPTSKPGQIYRLGQHRVMCGDSRNPEDVERLMAGEKANGVFTDPPYGVTYVGKTKDKLTIQNDGADGLEDLVRAAFACAIEVCRPGGIWYVAAPAGPQFLAFAVALSELEVWRQTITWVKDCMVMGHSDYHYKHEAIFYGWRPGARHKTPPDRKQTTVWEFDRPKASREHPTMKPVALYEHMFMMSTGPKALVYEPFGGSGTTLLAAERTGRRCNCMEIDPVYCDVIVRRWEEFTGEKATIEKPARNQTKRKTPKPKAAK